MNNFVPYPFRRHPSAHTVHDTYMTISTRVKCTAFVPSGAIPRCVSYLGTKQGSDDKMALSPVGGVLTTL